MRKMDHLIKMLSLLILAYATSVLCLCNENQVCVTEQRCSESDDSGAGILAPRSLTRACGTSLVCCDNEQLESYARSQASGKKFTSTRQSTNVVSQSSEKPFDLSSLLDYKSCDQDSLCVPRHLCKTGEVNTDGRFIIQPKINNASNSGCGVFEICCPSNERLVESESSVRLNVKDFKYKGCGNSNPGGLYYALVGYNDYESLFAEFPWMVALMDMQTNYVCGGTLIHPRLVLTSAHNVANHSSDTLLARAGEYDLRSDGEPLPFQTRRLRGLFRHERFNNLNFHNDIALLVLEQPFDLAPHIQPLCLPPTDSSQLQAQLRRAQCFAIGWGKRNISENFTVQILKRIDLPILEHGQCQQLLRETILGRRYKLDDSFICAGGMEGKDTCKGDGGSPLFCTMEGQRDRYQLAGIVSWGIECTRKDIPAAYTNVPYLRNWIEEKAWKEATIVFN
ncbi:phenoloxidase-activating factor 2 [Drosophila grimshawi]|uniref:Phenoloxidase-activating factor 2 n=1 Tax=Drosophila grimshawi TaxID=7222 RepID=B4J8M3_DROGR|nr:phenoloxidase-activating factor 2 [Drosophila grimshawi]XP_032590918.1 phenoloxidase-activating factor 2 [Drosophila grimshawi]EDW01290.1 GH20539 [Drosophila grimshawi]